MYQFNIHAIPPITVSIIMFSLGMVALQRNKKSIVHLAFFLLCLSAAVWQFGVFMAYLSTTEQLALFWLRVVYLGVPLLPASFFHFVVRFLNLERYRKLIPLAYLYAFVYLGVSRMDGFIGVYQTSWGFHDKEAGPLFHPFLVLFVIFWTTGLVILFTEYRKRKPGPSLENLRLKYVLLAFASVSFGMVDFLPGYRIQVYPIGYIFVTMMVFLLAYAMLRHRLMDIKALVLKSVVYSVIISLIALTYIFIIFYIKRYWEGIINPDVAFIAAGFAIAFGFQPLRRFIQKATDKVFAKGRYDFRGVIENLNQVLSSSLTEDDVIEPVLKTLSKDLRVSRASFVLTSSPQIARVDSVPPSSLPDKDNLSEVSKLIKDEKVVVSDELDEEDRLKEVLREEGIEVVVPLYKKEGVLGGFLALGEKKSGDAYTSEDMKLLEIISPQVSIALKNAERQRRLIEQVIEERERIQHDAHDKIYNKLGALAKTAEAALHHPDKMKPTLEKLEPEIRKTVTDLQEIVMGEER